MSAAMWVLVAVVWAVCLPIFAYNVWKYGVCKRAGYWYRNAPFDAAKTKDVLTFERKWGSR